MKKKIYCYRSHKLNTKSISLLMWEGFCGLSADRFSHRRWDTKPEDVRKFLDAKKSKIDSLLFQDKCKKNYPYSGHHRVSVERKSFLQFKWNFVNEMMDIWMLYIKIAGWWNKSIEDHDRLTDHDSRKPIARVFPASFYDSPIKLAPGPRR